MPSRFQHLPPPRASLPLQARELLRSPVEPHTDGLKPPVSPKNTPLHLPMRLPSHIPPPCLHRWAPAGARNAAEASAPWHLPSLPVTFPLYLGQKARAHPVRHGHHVGTLRRLLRAPAGARPGPRGLVPGGSEPPGVQPVGVGAAAGPVPARCLPIPVPITAPLAAGVMGKGGTQQAAAPRPAATAGPIILGWR